MMGRPEGLPARQSKRKRPNEPRRPRIGWMALGEGAGTAARVGWVSRPAPNKKETPGVCPEGTSRKAVRM